MVSSSFIKRNQRALFSLACIAAIGGLGMQTVHAAGFAANDLVVVSIDNAADGSAAVTLNGYQTTPTSATPDTTINIPTTLSLPGSNDHEGQISLSSNGAFLTMGVFNYAADQVTSPVGLAASVAPRDIITIDGTGTVNTVANLTNSYNTQDLREVTAIVNGTTTTYYLAGNDKGADQTAGLQVVTTTGSTVATTSTSLNNGHTTGPTVNGFDGRTFTYFNGVLYVSSGSSNGPVGAHTTATAVNANPPPTLPVGSNNPAITSTTYTAVPATGNGTPNNNMNQSPVFFSEVPADNGAPDVMYVSDSTDSGLAKWSLVSGVWNLDGIIKGINGVPANFGNIEDVAGRDVAGTYQIFVTTPTAVYGLADTNGWDQNFSSLTAVNTLETATGSEQFYGLSFAPTPTPEPASLGILALGGLAMLCRRKTKA